MPNQPNLLALVRQHLISHGESYQWVTMGAQSEKIGLAYLPVNDTEIPCSFMFTELKDPGSLVFDVNFAYRIAPADRAEVSVLLLTLNANLPEGQLLIDMESGLVYFRLKYVLPGTDISEEALRAQIKHMEDVGISMAHTYPRIILQEFPLY
ncbi:MAG: hypothetical protein J6R92_00615 [Akkermansia sp.]|nr:hypothetical protein [Akkermansia sp.]